MRGSLCSTHRGAGGRWDENGATSPVITASHPEGPARTRALSLWAAVGSSAGAVGVVLGGLLTTELSWRYVLFINVPIGVALLTAAAASLMPSPPGRDWARLDLPGALTVTVGAGSLVYAVSQATTKGWGSTPRHRCPRRRRGAPGRLRDDRGPQCSPARPAPHPRAAQPGRG